MLDPSTQDNLVDILVKRLFGQIDQLVNTVEVIEDLVRLLARLAVLAVKVRQDASAASVQPVPGVFFAVALDETGRDGLGCALVVRGIGRVFDMSAMMCSTSPYGTRLEQTHESQCRPWRSLS